MQKFKLNWGWSMLLVYAIFMSVFLYFFYVSFKELETNELVEEDYYQKELKYGEVIKKRQHADSMRVHVQFVQNDEGLKIIYPNYIGNIEGKVTLYKPDNSKLDQEFPIKLTHEKTMQIDNKKLVAGEWIIKLDWKDTKIEYFVENNLTIR